MFPPDRAIQNRPEEVATRETLGFWKGEPDDFSTISRLDEYGLPGRAQDPAHAVLFRNNDRSSKTLMARLINLCSPLPVAAHSSVTFDRGLEFVSWRELESGMGTQA